MVRCARVPKRDGEEVRNALMAAGMLDLGHAITSQGDYLCIPVLEGEMPYEEAFVDAPVIEKKETDFRNMFPESIRHLLPHSFDVIGDVAIVRIEESIAHLADEIGTAMMETNSRLRIVFRDGGVKGDLRVRELEQIAGGSTGETVHKESGVRIAVDPTKVYFNPRLATERMRIASLVEPGETVIDLFAGVAPFPLVICAHSKPSAVYAVDLNPIAADYARRNAEMNGFTNITVLQGDSREVAKDLPQADRVIMNIPQNSLEFLDLGLSKLKQGGVLHTYIVSSKDEARGMVEKALAETGYGTEIADISEMKTYSPNSSVHSVDVVRK